MVIVYAIGLWLFGVAAFTAGCWWASRNRDPLDVGDLHD